MAMHLPALLRTGVRAITLPASSAPATGSAKAHAAEHAQLIEKALRQDG
jgi:2-oxoglutarate dehydrogenase complex dehydrogenase (E1) component-like enzyme